MAIVRPFRAVRPHETLADKVAALPYDVMNSEEAREMVKDNPYSFLHVDKSEVDLPASIDLYDQRVYDKARENIVKFIEDGTLVQEADKALYIYTLVMDGHPQTGLVSLASIDDYQNNVIKKHEFTRAEKEADRIRHVDVTNFHTGPIFLTYVYQEEITRIIEDYKKNHDPLYDFIAEDGVQHTAWAILDEKIIEELKQKFEKVESLYIADGHHRAASAVRVGMMRREKNKDFTGDEEFNYFLSVIFPSNELRIMDYNRVVKDLNGCDSEQFMDAIRKDFTITAYEGEGPYRPEMKHTFGMYLDGRWYKLEAKKHIVFDEDPLKRLDCKILQDHLLHPVLGIEDPRVDKRIDFVGGIRGLKELERRVEKDMKVAFSMYPTTIMDLISISDAGMVMPPKSTWFEPKLRSGLFLHDLE
ncbi:DUF1015 domain-containing protein [Proteiniclasticum ruminis]|uniref:Uncharacterized conserved protein, DUF1015 family n=1 Tax=Proteiniclasticum ruminis TaxID=398199 RepID=A0A1G8QFC3_9CLOT|nr:DUF1015 family protein [Proteiniclasticum ruminis]SDJ03472.1 Uncharacterized conserved protein, DUF1015 family [Proteiniclasticum ruminis]